MMKISKFNEGNFWKKKKDVEEIDFITKINGKEFHELSSEEKKNIPDNIWKQISPYVKRDCYHCEFLKGYVTLWCTNDEAIEYRGTAFPGVYNCHFWQPNEKMIEKSKKELKIVENNVMKKFNEFLNENQQGIPTIAYELILKGEKYFIIANAKDTQMQVTFKEDGTKVDNFSINYLENEEDVEFKKINHIPPQILKSLEDMGAVVSSSLNVMKEPIEEPTEETEPKKSYANMGQSELNYQLNIAIDNEDWETAKEISTYLKEPLSESIVDKMTSVENEELKEIIDLLEENGYNYRGINVEDEGEWHQKERNKDVMWYVYGDDKYVKGKERDPKTHYISITKDSKLQEVKDRIQLYKKRYNL